MTKKTYFAKVILGFIITLVTFVAAEFYSIRKTEREYNYKIEETFKEKSFELRKILDSLMNDAYFNGKKQVDNITKDINKIYKNKETLELDLQGFVNGSADYTPIVKIAEQNTKGVYFNVKNDNNDPFIASLKNINGELKIFINSDYSVNCLSFGRSRSEDEEKTMHYSSELAAAALESAIYNNERYVYWHFLKIPDYYPWANEVKELDNIDFDYLFDLFAKYNYDLDFFKGFEFLTVNKINEFEDLAGNNISINGSFNVASKQLFYFYNFNLYDQLAVDKNLNEKIESYDKQAVGLIKEIKEKKEMTSLIIVIQTFVLVLLFLIVTSVEKPQK